jgi:hypothetical protein
MNKTKHFLCNYNVLIHIKYFLNIFNQKFMLNFWMRQLVNPLTFGRPCIGLALYGCRNRPFYHITVFPDKALGRHWQGNKIEEVFSELKQIRN